ncbi:hypothetical protein, partial [Klebsiella pneumoniae]|uniref:hypothetical protein n=1 Tax=Klebsiella pneumoniae TaxID=573 RepID=UPI0034D2AF76
SALSTKQILPTFSTHNTQKNKIQLSKHNKRFKRDSQRVAFLPCVGLCDYDVMRQVGSSVGCPLSGR